MTYRMNSLDPFYKRSAINDTAGEAPVAQGNESFLIALMCSAVQVMGKEMCLVNLSMSWEVKLRLSLMEYSAFAQLFSHHDMVFNVYWKLAVE